MTIPELLQSEREEFEKKFTEPRMLKKQEVLVADTDEVLTWLSSHDTKLLTALKEEVEGMKVKIHGYDATEESDLIGRSYNQALQDILAKLDEGIT